MARFPTINLLHLLGIIICTLSACVTAGFSIEEQLQLLRNKYDALEGKLEERLAEVIEHNSEITKGLAAKKVQLEALELKVARLEETVQQQEQFLIALKNENSTSSEFVSSGRKLASNEQLLAVGKNILFPRTCREVRAADPSLSSGMFWVDPDGQGVGDDPIYVYCDMTKGSTSVLHDSESSIDVGHCADPGCYSRAINYDATLRQIEALAELSNECHQSIQYDCNYAPFELNGITYAWWDDKRGISQTFWSGRNASVHTCQCGIDHNCTELSAKCNCDSAVPVPLTDYGVITEKDYLPITGLNFGRTQLESSSGVHTLGRFECSGQVTVNGMPKSCADLWRIGHGFNGLYLVMGTTQIESVYCNFAKLPSEPGFQTLIGYVDVKSSPVYFYVQRTSSFYTKNVPIPFDVTRLNVGEAMDLASGIFTAPRPGTYFFSFSGISDWSGANLQIGLYINGGFIGEGYSLSKLDTLAFQSTLRLNAGDKVSVQIRYGEGGLHEHATGSLYTHFTGWLLEELLSS